jgi:lysylphosphatidylglycerol synthetase-like protein (DUF2156 family)
MTTMSHRPSPSPPLEAELLDAVGVLQRHAENPSAFLALNNQTLRFSTPEVDGFVAYRLAGRRAVVQLGGPFADPADQPELLGAFLRHARSLRRRVVAAQLMQPDAELYAAHGFTVNQLGADYARDLDGFDLRGKKHMQLRNKISRARRAGVTVQEEEHLPALASELDDVDHSWLRAKGRHVKELQFLVGERGGPAQPLRRLFVARGTDGQVLGYVSFCPVHGSRAGWLHDLSRRRADAPPGVLELIVVTAVEEFRGEGAGFLHFGLTPFTSLSSAYEVASVSATAQRVVGLLASRGAALYPAADQLAYKEKWGPDLVQPEYVAFQGRLSLGGIWALLRLTNAA